MRTYEEIKTDVDAAIEINDAAALTKLAGELEAIDTKEATALRLLAEGVVFQLSSSYEQAMPSLEQALALYTGLNDSLGVARATNNLGNVHWNTGNYPKALEYYEQALALLKEAGDRSGIARVTGNIGVLHQSTGNYPTALEYYEQALALHKESGVRSGIATVTSNIGIVHSRTGNYPKALEYYEQALALHTESGERSGIARVTGNIGLVHWNTGNYPKALEYYEQALALLKEAGDRSGIARVTGNIGNVHMVTSNYPKALEYFEQALALHKEVGEMAGIAAVSGNIGLVHNSTGNYPKALEYYEQALALYTEVGNRSGIATATGNIGIVYQNTCNYPKALEYLEQALELFKKLGEQAHVAGCTVSIISCLLQHGDTERAKQMLSEVETLNIGDPKVYIGLLLAHATMLELQNDLEAAHAKLSEALAVATDAGLRDEEATCHERLRDLARKRNDFDGYIHHNNEYLRVNEEIRGKEATQKMAMMEAEKKIQTERAEREKERALLYSALPKSVVDRMIKGEDVSGDHFQDVSVLFLDIAGFTALCDSIPPAHVVHLLEQIFAALDKVSAQWGLTKIKTIGDSYMAACGLPDATNDHAARTAQAALQMIAALAELTIAMPPNKGDTSWTQDVGEIHVRIGLHCGPVTAGVIGTDRLQYDVWGDTVNVASRMESTGEPGRIHVSEAIKQALTENNTLVFTQRDSVQVKGKGQMTTYWLEHTRD